MFGPCSKFTQDAWDYDTGEYLNANTWIIINNPETLKQSITKANGTLEIPNSSSRASSTRSNSVGRSSGS